MPDAPGELAHTGTMDFGKDAQPNRKAKEPRNYELIASYSDLMFNIIFGNFKPDLIMCEMPPNQLQGHARMTMLGLHWQLRAYAGGEGIPMYSVAVPTLKKWATGSGKATKDEMGEAARKFYDGVITDDNHADAILAAHYGYEKHVLGIV
jgi:Holliday junction resolvasome RuvABC endonuclease subunit